MLHWAILGLYLETDELDLVEETYGTAALFHGLRLAHLLVSSKKVKANLEKVATLYSQSPKLINWNENIPEFNNCTKNQIISILQQTKDDYQLKKAKFNQ